MLARRQEAIRPVGMEFMSDGGYSRASVPVDPTVDTGRGLESENILYARSPASVGGREDGR